MKLNKNFVQISATALITSAAFMLTMASSGTGLFSASPAPSERITWTQATAMQRDYLDFKPLRVQIPEGDSHGDRRDLQGFTFSATQLRQLLDHNLSGRPVDSVYFQFGQEGRFGDDFLGGLFHDSGNIRLIAVGVSNNQRLITNSTGGTDISVYDKAAPCPPMCPQ